MKTRKGKKSEELILGHFQGVRTGIRQLIRKYPLETTLVRGLRVPTPEETLRIKASLIVKENTTRDFIDFVTLFYHLGVTLALKALDNLDALYPQDSGNSVSQQLASQLSDPKPWDLSQMDLSHYKGLKKEYADWEEIRRRAYTAGQKIIQQKLREK